MLRRRFQRPGPFSIWPVWKLMCHKVRVHALRDADNSQPIVPFYEIDNLDSVSFRLVPVPPRLRRLVCRPIHSFTPLPDRTVPKDPIFQAQISIPLLIPFHQIVDHLPQTLVRSIRAPKEGQPKYLANVLLPGSQRRCKFRGETCGTLSARPEGWQQLATSPPLTP